MTRERLGPGHREVHPPAAERQSDARDGELHRVGGPAVLAVDDRVERRDGADDDLAQRDDHEQPVALGDVVRMPRRPGLALGDERPGELERDQHAEQDERGRDRQVEHGERHPSDLGDGDRRHVGPGLWVLARHLPPQEHQRHAHDHVAGHHHVVVQRVAVVDRGEHLRQAERQDDHARHLHHRRQPEDPVVGVVGRREPRVVEPRPADGERREGEAAHADADVVLCDVVSEPVGGGAERDDDRQVVKELQRRRRSMALAGVAPAEAPPGVSPLRGQGRRRNGG